MKQKVTKFRERKSSSKVFTRQMALKAGDLLAKCNFHSQMASKISLFTGLLVISRLIKLFGQ